MDGGSSDARTSLSLAELEAQITELAGHLNAANYRWLRLIEEFDRRHGWGGWEVGVLRALAEFQMRPESRRCAREGAGRPRAGRVAADRRLHGARGIELLQSAGPLARRLSGD